MAALTSRAAGSVVADTSALLPATPRPLRAPHRRRRRLLISFSAACWPASCSAPNATTPPRPLSRFWTCSWRFAATQTRWKRCLKVRAHGARVVLFLVKCNWEHASPLRRRLELTACLVVAFAPCSLYMPRAAGQQEPLHLRKLPEQRPRAQAALRLPRAKLALHPTQTISARRGRQGGRQRSGRHGRQVSLRCLAFLCWRCIAHSNLVIFSHHRSTSSSATRDS